MSTIRSTQNDVYLIMAHLLAYQRNQLKWMVTKEGSGGLMRKSAKS
jgi:hypothetical protein